MVPALMAEMYKGPGHNRDELVALAFDLNQVTNKDNRSNPQPGDPCHTLPGTQNAPLVAPTIVRCGDAGSGFRDEHGIVGTIPRRLTPTECERLQGFPDGWTDVDGMKDGPRYRMCGNAVTVNVLEWIGRRIMEAQK